MQNFEKKKGLEIWWKGTFPPNFPLICLTGSEKKCFKDDGRRMDGRTGGRRNDGRLRDDSNYAVQYHKADLKIKLKAVYSQLKIFTSEWKL